MCTNLNELKQKRMVTKNSNLVDKSKNEVKQAPSSTKEFKIDYSLSSHTDANDEYILTLNLKNKEKTLWADHNHEIAFEQFLLPVPKSNPEHVASNNLKLTTTINKNTLVIQGENLDRKSVVT